MKEIIEIIKAYDKATQAGKQTALATVVHVEGSSYRRPGARMLVTEDGALTGAISGGCLEGDALRKARLVMAQQKSLLITYDTSDDDDAKLGVGLGCNGIIHILIEPLQTVNEQNPIQLLKEVVSERQEAVLVTLFHLEDRHAPQPGTCLLFLEKEEIITWLAEGSYPESLFPDVREAFNSGTSAINIYKTPTLPLTAFIEFLVPAISLVIIGAGNDIFPLVQMTNILGWEVTVVDGRANYATLERFPTAQKVLVAKANQVLDQVNIDAQTVFALMTHNYLYDMAVLRELLSVPVPYIGSLGPKKKLERMLAELTEEGISISPAQLNRIYGPTGLDLGAETSEEIALSIVAEIRAVLAKKSGGFLRDISKPIHERPAKVVKANLETKKATCEIEAGI